MGQIIFHTFSKAVDKLKKTLESINFQLIPFFIKSVEVYEKNKNLCTCENIFPNEKENPINQLVNIQPI